jgi:hypothetical protein
MLAVLANGPAASRVFGTPHGLLAWLLISLATQIARDVLFHPLCRPLHIVQRLRHRARKKVLH